MKRRRKTSYLDAGMIIMFREMHVFTTRYHQSVALAVEIVMFPNKER